MPMNVLLVREKKKFKIEVVQKETKKQKTKNRTML